MPWPGRPKTDKGAPTKALPEIWTEQAKFKEHSEKLEAETVKLAAAAKTGNLDNLKTAFMKALQALARPATTVSVRSKQTVGRMRCYVLRSMQGPTSTRSN